MIILNTNGIKYWYYIIQLVITLHKKTLVTFLKSERSTFINQIEIKKLMCLLNLIHNPRFSRIEIQAFGVCQILVVAVNVFTCGKIFWWRPLKVFARSVGIMDPVGPLHSGEQVVISEFPKHYTRNPPANFYAATSRRADTTAEHTRCATISGQDIQLRGGDIL